jgi:homoserine dehydrogenase
MQIGLIGYGEVGRNVAKILNDLYPGALVTVAKRDWERKDVKQLYAWEVQAFDDWRELFLAFNYDAIIEVVDTAEVADQIWETALAKGIHIVSANKALIASQRGLDLLDLGTKLEVKIRYEAAVAGAIPIVANLLDNFKGDRIVSIEGILNGATNYILGNMFLHNSTFEEALKEAQTFGFLETDPSLDIKGVDAANKIAILARLAFGTRSVLDDVKVQGIERIDSQAVAKAMSKGNVYKLIASAQMIDGSVQMQVKPRTFSFGSDFAKIFGSINLVRITTQYGGEFTFTGPGAGGEPTASAVVNDVVRLFG